MAFEHDRRTALIIVDMVVDSVTGWWPVYNALQVTDNVIALRDASYRAGVPVIQLKHTYRADGLDAPLNEARHPDGTPQACVEGTPGAAFVPGLEPDGRDIVIRKSRWHGFFGTELTSVLHQLRAEQLVWAGCFTDACVLLSVFEGFHHDYPAALAADACSCTNEFVHKTAVLNMANWVLDLSIFTTANLVRWIDGEDSPHWYSGRHNALPYASEADVHRMYEQVVGQSAPTPQPAAG